jgi:hypothetical protein
MISVVEKGIYPSLEQREIQKDIESLVKDRKNLIDQIPEIVWFKSQLSYSSSADETNVQWLSQEPLMVGLVEEGVILKYDIETRKFKKFDLPIDIGFQSVSSYDHILELEFANVNYKYLYNVQTNKFNKVKAPEGSKIESYHLLKTNSSTCIIPSIDSSDNNFNLYYLVDNETTVRKAEGIPSVSVSAMYDMGLDITAVLIKGDLVLIADKFLSLDGCRTFKEIHFIENDGESSNTPENDGVITGKAIPYTFAKANQIYYFNPIDFAIEPIYEERLKQTFLSNNKIMAITSDGQIDVYDGSLTPKKRKNLTSEQLSNFDYVGSSDNLIYFGNYDSANITLDYGLNWINPSLEQTFDLYNKRFRLRNSNIIELDDDFVLSQNNDKYISTDEGQSFRALVQDPNTKIQNSAYSEELWVVTTSSGMIMTSSDKGNSWTKDNIMLGAFGLTISSLSNNNFVITSPLGYYLHHKNIKLQLDEVKNNNYLNFESLEKVLATTSHIGIIDQASIYNQRIYAQKALLEVVQLSDEQASSVRFEKHLIRFSIFAAMLYIIQVLVSAYRYNTRMSDFYMARYDSLVFILATNENVFEDIDMNVVISLLTPDIDFGKANEASIESVVSAAQKLKK